MQRDADRVRHDVGAEGVGRIRCRARRPHRPRRVLEGRPEGDLHNHLTGAVYAETYLGWGRVDGDCVNTTSKAAVAHGSCSATNVAMPSTGALFDSIIATWSMEGFVPGAETGHHHFFATFGKYGLVPGTHRDQTIADVATRAISG